MPEPRPAPRVPDPSPGAWSSQGLLHRATSRRATAGAALVLLVAWLVGEAQAFLTYNRLMVGTAYRDTTPLSRALLALGLLLAVVVTVQGLAARRHAGAWRDAAPPALPTALAACVVGYGVAVTQWYLVIHQASTAPETFRRDPTPLEPLLLTAALVLAAAVALRSVRARARG
ncbi:hypothetical protein [Cellulomonas sp. B6]|uniref:hypothetical protein n=1 Tax=Cellulomonas sp. B6 TaxID=1295626 RepID=UPI00073C2B76|nr:hypothetical protein [Cellulomonas sp. B6]KSW29571.1 hypothetical protein ATM99_07410 [Cellulomonas sp. B6]